MLNALEFCANKPARVKNMPRLFCLNIFKSTRAPERLSAYEIYVQADLLQKHGVSILHGTLDASLCSSINIEKLSNDMENVKR